MARSNLPTPEGAPTMIIPNGTKIEVDSHGQLNIRTPGNLVIQNSGSYGVIESATGSIRIEPNVQVEAVNIECADVCYVQGSLTAWKVKARAIELDESARAHIILQETESLQIGNEARLVGNFSSEKELFLLMSRFAKQLRSIPFYSERRGGAESLPPLAGATPVRSSALSPSPPAAANDEEAASPESTSGELHDSLFFALVLLEREAGRAGNGPTSHKAVEELVRLLRRRELEELSSRYESVFSEIFEPSEDVVRARELVHDFFDDGSPIVSPP